MCQQLALAGSAYAMRAWCCGGLGWGRVRAVGLSSPLGVFHGLGDTHGTWVAHQALHSRFFLSCPFRFQRILLKCGASRGSVGARGASQKLMLHSRL